MKENTNLALLAGCLATHTHTHTHVPASTNSTATVSIRGLKRKTDRQINILFYIEFNPEMSPEFLGYLVAQLLKASFNNKPITNAT
jgi:hypothetical protein